MSNIIEDRIEQKIDDYKRRIKTVSDIIDQLENISENNEARIRLGTKASLYREFYHELEDLMKL